MNPIEYFNAMIIQEKGNYTACLYAISFLVVFISILILKYFKNNQITNEDIGQSFIMSCFWPLMAWLAMVSFFSCSYGAEKPKILISRKKNHFGLRRINGSSN